MARGPDLRQWNRRSPQWELSLLFITVTDVSSRNIRTMARNKKLCYRRRTARCAVSVEILSTAAQLWKQVVQKNPQQFEVVELEGYSRPTCNVRTTPRQSWCDLQARPLTSFVDTPSAPSPSTCRGEIIFKTRVWDGVSEGRTLIFEATRISLSNGVG